MAHRFKFQPQIRGSIATDEKPIHTDKSGIACFPSVPIGLSSVANLPAFFRRAT
jgi:hypothetical protein